MPGRQAADRGFTLLEVLVAVVLLGLAYVAVLQSFSMSSSQLVRLEKKRGAALGALLDFDRALQETPAGGEVFMAGNKFVLRRFSSQDGQLETLRLSKE